MIGHIVHLEGCIIEDGALVGNGSVVLHSAIVRTGALVGSNAVVPNSMEVPSGAMALGVPAKIREDAVHPGMIQLAMQSYVDRSQRYRETMRGHPAARTDAACRRARRPVRGSVEAGAEPGQARRPGCCAPR